MRERCGFRDARTEKFHYQIRLDRLAVLRQIWLHMVEFSSHSCNKLDASPSSLAFFGIDLHPEYVPLVKLEVCYVFLPRMEKGLLA